MTGKKKFRAETVLAMRRRHEEEARQSFAAARTAVDAVRLRIAALAAAMEAYDAEMRQAIQAGADRRAMETYRQCATGIRRALRDEKRRLEVADRTLQIRREDLLEARKAREVLSRLRDRLALRQVLAERSAETRRHDDAHAAHAAARGEA